MPLVLPEMEFTVSLVPVLIISKQPFRLRFLAGLHPLRDDLGETTLANHLQDVLAIELAFHQDIIDVDELFSRIQQVLDNPPA
ncbi:hypothetical protein JCM31271_30390 [Halorubrum trueperi]